MLVQCVLGFFFFISNINIFVTSVTVRTLDGSVYGSFLKTPGGKKIYTFLGIPYAKPPVEELRFMEPQPVDYWYGVKRTQKFSPRCIQYVYHKPLSEAIVGQEDCLYLNIYTPEASTKDQPFDVIVFIHGGGFMSGGSDMYTPEYILDEHDLVFVSLNYRLGPFGFLSTEDNIVPGNNGLKDQALALKWVYENIGNFGGNKDRITLAGVSAGAASVHLHFFSSLSTPYFRQGISMGGTALCPWVLTENAHSKAKKLGESVNCPTESSEDLVNCLRQKDAKSLLSQIDHLFLPWNYNPFTPFGPVVEKKGPNIFLKGNPYELLINKELMLGRWLVSATTEEGLYPGAAFITDERKLKELIANWNEIAPHLLDYNNTVPRAKLDLVSKKIQKYYNLENQEITPDFKKKVIEMIGDRLFLVDIERATLIQASFSPSPIYFYRFGYRGKYSIASSHCNCEQDLGVSHGDDSLYILKTEGMSALETTNDKKMVQRMVRFWINFIEHGSPTVNLTGNEEWMPVPPEAMMHGNITYLHIFSSDKSKIMSSADLGHREFWDPLPVKELWNTEKIFFLHDDL